MFVFLQDRAAAVVFKLGLCSGPQPGSAWSEKRVGSNSPHEVPQVHDVSHVGLVSVVPGGLSGTLFMVCS